LLAIEAALNDYKKKDNLNLEHSNIKQMSKADEMKMRQNEEKAFQFLDKFCEVEKVEINENDLDWEDNFPKNNEESNINMDEDQIFDDKKFSNFSHKKKMRDINYSHYEDENLIQQHNNSNTMDVDKNNDQTTKFKKVTKNIKKRQVNDELS
jgi:hypothetical protein